MVHVLPVPAQAVPAQASPAFQFLGINLPLGLANTLAMTLNVDVFIVSLILTNTILVYDIEKPNEY